MVFFGFAKKTSPVMKERDKNAIIGTLSFCLSKFIGGVPMAKLESKFQSELIKELKRIFVGCLVMKLDSSYIQGIPDLLVLHNNHWATLECKKNANASKRPNQEYYVDKMNDMSFSRFVCPENKEEVLDDLRKTFES